MPKTAKNHKAVPEIEVDRQPLKPDDALSYKSAHRRLAFVSRTQSVIIIFLSLVVVGLSQAFSGLFPLKEIRIVLVRADPATDKIYRVQPISENVDGFELEFEAKARKFVWAMLTIDAVTQDSRFAEASRVSDPKFFNRFLDEHKALIEEALDDGLNRSITVETANKVSEKNGFYQYAVDFNRIDRVKDAEPVERKLRAYLIMTARPQDVAPKDKYTNPLGVIVTDLVVKERYLQ